MIIPNIFFEDNIYININYIQYLESTQVDFYTWLRLEPGTALYLLNRAVLEQVASNPLAMLNNTVYLHNSTVPFLKFIQCTT